MIARIHLSPRTAIACYRQARVFGAVAALAATQSLGLDHASGAPPAPTPPPTAAAGNWSAWTAVTGPVFLSPALTFNPGAGAPELATVRPDLKVDHFRLIGGKWNGPLATGSQSFLPPVLLVDEGGAPQLLATDPSTSVGHARFQGGAWVGPTPTGVSSFFPPAAAVNPTGNVLELVTVGPDGSVRHSRFQGGVWSAPTPLNAISFLPPTLAASPAGGLELAIIGLDRQLYHARFQGSVWSPFQPTGVFSELAPALAVSSDAVVHLAATGLNRNVVYSRFQNNTWSAPVATGIQSSLSPAMVFNSGTNTLELLARGLDRVVQHGRSGGQSWAAPQALGITTDARPALSAGATGTLDAAVTATDGRVYVSHFSGAPAPPPPVSFTVNVLPILTRNCARIGCHLGSSAAEGLNLAANQAYDNLVSVESSENSDLKLIEPGDPANSYLFLKITDDPNISGRRMPLTGSPLSAADIETIRQWIEAGAKND